MDPQNQSLNQNIQQKDIKKCKHIPIIIDLAILSIGGLGFGGFELWQNTQQKGEIKNLKEENDKFTHTNKEKPNESSMTSPGEEKPSDTPTSPSVVSGPYIDEDYFYVPEWKLKFKIPKELDGIGYSVDLSNPENISIGFSGYLKKDKVEYAHDLFYDRIDTCAIVSVQKKEGQFGNKDGALAGGGIKQFDDYALFMWGYEARDTCDIKLNIDEVKKTIQEMFSNPEKI